MHDLLYYFDLLVSVFGAALAAGNRRLCEGDTSPDVPFDVWARACEEAVPDLGMPPLQYLMVFNSCGGCNLGLEVDWYSFPELKDRSRTDRLASRLPSLEGYLSPYVCDPTRLVLEFGVFQGSSISRISNWHCNNTVYGFDNFTGLPEAWQDTMPAGSFSTNGREPETKYNVKIVRGLFEQSLPDWKPLHVDKKIAFLHMDADLYSSTLTVLDHLVEYLAPGSVILFDDLLSDKGDLLDTVRKLDGGRGGELGALYNWSRSNPHIQWRWIGRRGRDCWRCGAAALVITSVGAGQVPLIVFPEEERILGTIECSRPQNLAFFTFGILIDEFVGCHWATLCLSQSKPMMFNRGVLDFVSEERICPGPWLQFTNGSSKSTSFFDFGTSEVYDLGNVKPSAWKRAVRNTLHGKLRIADVGRVRLCVHIDLGHAKLAAVALNSLTDYLIPSSVIVLANARRGNSFRSGPQWESMGEIGGLGKWWLHHIHLSWKWLCHDRYGAMALIFGN